MYIIGMEVESFDNPWMKKIRFLTNLLLISVALNVGLLTAFIYVNRTQKNIGLRSSKHVILEKSNAEVLAAYFMAEFPILVKELKDKTALQDGYSKRDLALACLVNYHYLNLEKAISGKTLQRRKLTFLHSEGGESFQLEVFPNLDDLDFIMVEKFIKEEKWPFSAEGLFVDLKKHPLEKDPSLEAAFFATPEFYMLYTSFKRLDETLTKEKTLQFLLETDFDDFSDWIQKTKAGGDFLEGIRTLFHETVKKGSSFASSFWISLDSEYIQRKLTDPELLQILSFINESSLTTNIFLKQILCSVRSDDIRKESALKLYEFAKISPPTPYDHSVALKTFLPTMFDKKQPALQAEKAAPISIKHTVTDGDSLWKIARKYKVSIESLRQHNHLKKDALKPGQELLIPLS